VEGTSTRMAATSSARTSPSLLRLLAAITLVLLAVQFIDGMLVNLFVTLPAVHPGANNSNYFLGVVQGVIWALTHGTLYLLIHVAIGWLLFLLALILLGLAILSRRHAWIISSILGLLFIIGAGFNGASFLNYGQNFSSLLMSILFLLSVIAYAVGFYVTR
jgi:hypothetical protein